MKLSDTQRAILIAAASHPERLIQPPPSPPAPRAQIARKFLDHGIAEACTSPPGFSRLLWGGDVASGLRITDDGLRAIGIEPAADAAPRGAEAPAPRHEDAPAPEATQDAPVAQGEGDAPEQPTGDTDLSYQPIAQAMIRAIGTITAHAADQSAWSRFCADHADLVAGLRTAAARKPSRTPRAPIASRKAREGTKQEAVLALLRRNEGATIAQVIEATGWQSHTVRGFLAGLKRKGITVEVLERIRQVGPNKEGAKGSYSIYRIAG